MVEGKTRTLLLYTQFVVKCLPNMTICFTKASKGESQENIS